jgi:hypothetical protein
VVKDILFEIATQEGLYFPLAIIHTEQDKRYLKQRLREGRAQIPAGAQRSVAAVQGSYVAMHGPP